MPLGDARYLLSPGDLYTLHQVPEIIELGISTLKIEGRYKDENYVALTTNAYRRAVDAAWAACRRARSRAEEVARPATGLFARARARISSPAPIIRQSSAAARRGIAACCADG